MYGRRRVNNFYVYARPSIHCLLDFLKNLRFSFPVPVVGPSTKDFYPLQRAKFTGEIFLPWVLSNHERFYWCAVNQTRSRHMLCDSNCFDWNYDSWFGLVLTYFDCSRRHTHATTHATGTQIVRDKMTSLDAIFCRGNKSSSRSLARFCRRKQKKIYRSRFALVHENYATVKSNPWEKFQNLRGFECKTTQPWLGGKSCFFLYKSFKSFGGRCNRCFSDIRARSILKPRVWFQTKLHSTQFNYHY